MHFIFPSAVHLEMIPVSFPLGCLIISYALSDFTFTSGAVATGVSVLALLDLTLVACLFTRKEQELYFHPYDAFHP